MCEAPARRWVEIGFTVLTPEQRTTRLPEDTRVVPYYGRLKGFVSGEVAVGEEVEVETVTGRRVRGEVLRIEPEYTHSFGRPVVELIQAGVEARSLLAWEEGVPPACGAAREGA